TRQEAIAVWTPRLQVSLELAGPLLPIDPKRADEGGELLRMGMDGVAARVGEKTVAIFPGQMMTAHQAPRVALGAAAARVADDAQLGIQQLAAIAASRGARFYKFSVVHLVQAAPAAEPIFVELGGREIPLVSVTGGELRNAVDGLAAHLARRAEA